MARIAKFATAGAATLAALTMATTSASAATTTVTPSGSIQLAGSVTASGTTCTSTLGGSVASNGTALGISTASFSCGALVTITPQGLPWNGGNITYAPVTGGRNFTLTIANFKIKAVALGLTCYYNGNLTGNGFNPGNPAAPGGASASTKVAFNNTVSKAAGSSILCPATTSLTANFTLTASGTPVVVTS